MEYDNDENTWRRHSTPKMERSTCHQIPKRSTSVAVVVLGLAVLSCLLGYCVLSETLPYESKTLRLVVILFRHGARTPVESYNSDPYKNYQWPEGLGGLTNAGKLQLYELGKKYRSYYANFIPEEYYDKDVFVRSSDKSRCLMSAYTFLAGLYPPTERQLWHPELPWQPVPVHSLPKELDNSMRSVVPVDFLYSTLLSEQEAGLKLPEWTRTVFPSKMKTPFMLSLALLSYNETLQRLKTFYRNNTKVEVPLELKLPFCDDPCTYTQFTDHITKLIPEDWEAECGNK
ncbi:hypothetical protein HF086_005036 [Spodoptera exigua]|uniref:Lysosomal acid phosphatase n=1 Tax=Spodoptera exigua TaxID=7107 RepID=A0A922MM28_SPOEX|nr:hypothetical protein HF086_005036 [Spodoptera exigua]